MARGVRAGAAYVEILADLDQLEPGLKAAQAKLEAFGGWIEGLGAKMVGLSGAALAPVAAGAKAFADFDKQMAMVSTALDRPQEHMGRFTTGIRDMSIQFGESTDTLAKGLYDILGAAISPSQAMDVLGVATRAAVAGITQTGVAGDALTTILNAYGKSADQAGAVSDWMFKVVERGKLTFDDIAETIGRSANLAHLAGLSLEEVGAFIATMTRNGVQSNEAMTNLNAIIKSFLKPSKEAASAAEDLGFHLDAASLQSKGLLGNFQELALMKPETLAKLFPDIDAFKGIAAGVGSLNAMREDMTAISGAAGSTEAAYQKMAATLSTSMAQLEQSGVATFVSLGQAVSGLVKDLIDNTMSVLATVRQWIDSHQELVATGTQVALVVGAIGSALVIAGGIITAIAAPFGILASIVGAVSSAFLFVGALIGTMLTPMFWAIVGVVGYLGSEFLKLVATTSGSWDSIGSIIGYSWGKIQDLIFYGSNLIKAAWEGDTYAMGRWWELFTQGAENLWMNVKHALELSWQKLVSIWQNKTELLSKFFEQQTRKIKDLWSKAEDYLLSGWRKLNLSFSNVKMFAQMAAGVMAVVVAAKLLAAAFAVVPLVLGAIGTALSLLFSPIGLVIAAIMVGIGALGAILYKLSTNFQVTMDSVWAAIQVAWGALWDFLAAGWHLMTAVFSGDTQKMQTAWGDFKETAHRAWDALWNVLSVAWEEMQKLWSRKVDAFKEVWDSTMGAIGLTWKRVQDIIEVGWMALRTAWALVVGMLTGEFQKAGDRIIEIWRLKGTELDHAWQDLKLAFNSVCDSFMSSFNSAVEYLKRKFNEFIALVWSGLQSIPGVSWVTGTSSSASFGMSSSARTAALVDQISMQMASVPAVVGPAKFAIEGNASVSSNSTDERMATTLEKMNRLLDKIDGRVADLGLTFH